MIARMQIKETAWDTLLANPETGSEDVQRLLRNRQALEIEAQNPAGFIMVNAIGSETEIDALYNYFAAGDRQAIWKWNFNGKVDFATEYTGQQNDILATQPSGATFEDPEWVNSWMGQGDSIYIQRFARAYTRGFGEGFS